MYMYIYIYVCVCVCVCVYTNIWASLLAQMVKNLPAMWETQVQSLDWEDPLEKGMATHSGILAWRIPRTEEPSRDCKEYDTTEQLSKYIYSYIYIHMGFSGGSVVKNPPTNAEMWV